VSDGRAADIRAAGDAQQMVSDVVIPAVKD
jgi:hypothetical protein